MAFRKKADFILKHMPDILIVAECEHPDKLLFPIDTLRPTDLPWFGDNKNKGLAIFSYCDLKIKLLGIHNPDYKYVLPLKVYNDKIDFAIIAIAGDFIINKLKSVEIGDYETWTIHSDHKPLIVNFDLN